LFASHNLRNPAKNISMMTFLTRFAIYGVIGWSMEVLWTGLGSLLKRDLTAKSTTSIWMFFIYGSAAFFTPFIDLISPLPLMARGVIYALCIFAIEYAAGMTLRYFDMCPWDYSDAKTSVQGVIRLDYAPVWFGVGLLFEFTYFRFLAA